METIALGGDAGAVRKLLGTVVGLACALTLAVGATGANGARQSPIVFTVHNLGEAACSDGVFALSFDMRSPAGSLLGKGVSCVHEFPACFAEAGCRDTFTATFTLDFAQGSLEIPVVFNELWLTDSMVLQVTTGTIASGTGAFAGAAGSLFCIGTVTFVGFEAIPHIVCFVRLS